MQVGGACRYLEHFDLAAGRVQVLRVLPALVLPEGVDLHAEGNALLAAVLAQRELRADAVHLRTGELLWELLEGKAHLGLT